MKNESREFFLRCVNDFLNGRLTELPENPDLEEIYKLFENHKMQGILFHQIRSQINAGDYPEAFRTQLFRSYAHQCFQYKKRCVLLEKIHGQFQKNNIPYLIFKGVEVAGLYPVPALRTMGDSDILVHPEDKEKADAALLSLGFQNEVRGDNEWIYQHTGMHFELHHRMMNDEAANDDAQKVFFKKNWDYAIPEENSVRYHFDWNYHFIYILTHLRKHFVNAGIGFRPFIDLAVIASRCKLDWDWIQTELNKMNMTKFATVCMTLCNRWFGVPSPLLQKTTDEDFYADATDAIFKNGLFGAENPDNKHNYDMYRMRKSGSGSFRLAVKDIFKVIFPSYNTMKAMPAYSFLKGRPLLLPCAWVVRWCRGLWAGKAKSTCNKLTDVMNISVDNMNNRDSILDKWGI